MNKFNFVATCLFGIESVLSFEVKKLGADDVKTFDGRVEFSGDERILIDSHLWLRTAERVLIKLGSFVATTFDELFEGVKKINFEDYIGSKDQFPVKGWSINSTLFSVSDCQSIIKKSVVERLKSKYNVEWFEETGPIHQIQFSIHKDEVCIFLDSSGAGLHKRGYRRNSSVAPIKETLACGIIDLARVKSNSTLYDPFCGSGTFPIESTMKSLNIAPGLFRKFSFEKWGLVSENLIKDRRKIALESIDKNAKFKAYASDIEKSCIDLTYDNAKKIGLQGRMKTKVLDIRDFEIYDKTENNIVICNPPYGQRLLEKKSVEEIYKVMSDRFDTSLFSYYIISPHEDFEYVFGQKASKRRKLYNGMIKCQLYMYYKK